MLVVIKNLIREADVHTLVGGGAESLFLSSAVGGAEGESVSE